MIPQIERVKKFLDKENPDPDTAIRMLKRLLGENTQWPVFHLMGIALLQKKDYQLALANLKKAIMQGSDESATYHLISVSYMHLGQFEEAENYAKEALDRNEDFFEAWLNLGAIYNAQAQMDKALECYKEANNLDPQNAGLAFRVGTMYRDRGDLDKALELFDVTLKLDSDYSSALMEKADIFKKKGKFEKAKLCLEEVKEKEDSLAVNVAMAELHKKVGKYEEAIEIYDRLLSEHPENYNLRINYALCFQETGQFAKSEKHYLKTMNDQPKSEAALSNYLMGLHYNPERTKDEIFEAHLQVDERYMPEKRSSRPVPVDTSKDKKLRIGLISGGFRRHPVGWMISQALENLPKDHFEIYCYTTNNVFDSVTKRIHQASDEWISVIGYKNEIVAKMIRDDGIDILVELSGHSEDNRLKMVALEPAPIIVKWVGGLFNTSGLKAVDFLISDWHQTPEGEEKYYTEKLVRMPEDYICFLPPSYAPDVVPLPAKKKGYITFGCFNNPTKINEKLLEKWAKIMNCVPGSRLFLKSKQYSTASFTNNIIEKMGEYGIKEERLIFEGAAPHKDLLASYNNVDIALDPWPYSGGLSTCEALLMGVPVITLPGPTFAGRHSTTHLNNAGLPELISANWEEYIEKAISLASDIDGLAKMRSMLRQQIVESPLCDGKRFAAHLSIAFRKMWKQWVEGRQQGKHDWKGHIEIEPLTKEEVKEQVPKNAKSDHEIHGRKDVIPLTAEKNPNKKTNRTHWDISPSSTNGLFANSAKKPNGSGNERTYKIHADNVTVCTPANLDLLTPFVLLEQGQWFDPEISFIFNYLQEGMNVVDVGAGFGVYALAMAEKVGENGQVYAFEPSPETRRYLEMSTLENEFDHLEVIGKALSDNSGRGSIITREMPEYDQFDEEGNGDIPFMSLDAWWKHTGRPEIDLIKIDINGSSERIFEGGAALFKNSSPLILVALNENKQQIGQVINLLEGKGFQFYQCIPGMQLLTKFNPQEGVDPYVLNLFAMKDDMAKKLNELGFLFQQDVEIREPQKGVWRSYLQDLPWTNPVMSEWNKIVRSSQNEHYLRALDYLCTAETLYAEENEKKSFRSEKVGFLLKAAQLLVPIYNDGNRKLPLVITLARVFYKLGERAQAVEILKDIMEGNKLASQKSDLELPFLLPLPSQDISSIKTDFNKWLMVRIVEAWILMKDHSTYFSGNKELELMGMLEENPEIGEDITRRLNLLKKQSANNGALIKNEEGVQGENSNSSVPLFIHLCFNNMHTQAFVELLDVLNSSGKQRHIAFVEERRSVSHFTVDLSDSKHARLFSHQKLSNLMKMIESMNPAVIIVHGLFYQWQKKFVKEVKTDAPVYWSVWGGDLYNPIKKGTPFYEVAGYIDGVISKVDGDYELLEKTYGKKHRISSFTYGVRKGLRETVQKVSKIKPRRIIVGNSGDPSNQHLQVIEALAKKGDIHEYQIYIPFAYNGPPGYLQRVKECVLLYGLDDITTYQTEFIPEREYDEILMESSYVICAHDRQQAFGTIKSSLFFGNIVFVRNKIQNTNGETVINPTWSYFREDGFPIQPWEEFLGTEKISGYEFPSKKTIQSVRDKLKSKYDVEEAARKDIKGFDEILKFHDR